jgi:hypothetical protein
VITIQDGSSIALIIVKAKDKRKKKPNIWYSFGIQEIIEFDIEKGLERVMGVRPPLHTPF